MHGGHFDVPRFDVYRNSGSHTKEVPFLLDVQSPLLNDLDTRVVIPLRRRDCFPVDKLPDRLMPVFAIEEVSCLLETPKLAAIPRRALTACVISLVEQQIAITTALDFLFQGY